MFSRHPIITATAAATLNRLSGGRLILGLGTGSSRRIKTSLGLGFSHPLAATREAVQLIRQFLSGQSLEFQGKFYRVKGSLASELIPETPIPIWVEGRSKLMLQMASEVGDGVFGVFYPASEYATFILENIQVGINRAPKDFTNLDIALWVPIFPMKNKTPPSDAFAYAKRRLSITPPQILKLLGISSVGCSHRDLLRLVVTGTAEECRTQLEPFYDKLGAKMIFALTERNYSPDLFDFLEEVTAF